MSDIFNVSLVLDSIVLQVLFVYTLKCLGNNIQCAIKPRPELHYGAVEVIVFNLLNENLHGK